MAHRARISRVARFFLAALMAAGLGWAQVEQAAVTGTVTDQTGASVPKAAVTVTNVATGVDVAAETNDLGYYRVPYLTPGGYALKVRKDGFAPERVDNIRLSVGLTATVNVVLKPGAMQQEVTVSAIADVLLEQQGASLGNVVDAEQMMQLPLLGRNPYALVTLAPGVMPNGNAGTGPIINGGPSNTSGVLLDGAETRNTTTGDIAYSPPLETVAEFKVITNNFSAEYGRSGGGILTVAGVSGTNKIHGSAYEFFRNDKLNANGWTNNRSGLARTAYKRNEFGAAVGGPVVIPHLYQGRNRTFFFVNLDGNVTHTPDNLIANVPTAEQRLGDFSQTFAANGNLIQVFDPDSAHQVSGQWVRDQFPGNRIPASRIHPISAKVMAYYPAANRSGIVNNYAVANTRIAQDLPKFYYRIDHNTGSGNRIFLRHGFQMSEQNTAWPDNIAFPGEGTNGGKGYVRTLPQSATVSDTWVIRTNLVGEFRASLTRNIRQDIPRSDGFDFTALGLPQSLKNASLGMQFPRFDITDLTSVGPDRIAHDRIGQTTQDAQGHITWMRGAHSVKAGVDYLFFAFNVAGPDWPSGQYQFGRTFTQGPNPNTASISAGYGLATFLIGTPTGGNFTLGPSLAASQRAWTGYVQDDWRVSRRYTLNLGIRYEYQMPWTERYNHLSYFDPEATEPSTGLKGLLRFAGEKGGSRYQTYPDRNNVAPRLGMAYELSRTTVLRGGYGVFYFPGNGGIGGGVSDLGSGWQLSTPVYLGPPAAAPSSPSPGGSISNPFSSGLLIPPTNNLGGSVSAPFARWITPFIHQWNFNIQRIAMRGLLIEAAYVGTRGQRLWANIQADGTNPAYLATLGTALNDVVPNPYYGAIPVGSLSGRNVRRAVLLEPFPQYNNVVQTRAPIGDSIYHGFTLRADRRMRNGLQFQVSYTISKLISDVPERFGGRTSIINPYDLHMSRSVGDMDRPQFVVSNFIYELPFGRGKKWARQGVGRALAGGWQVSGILTFGPGLPLVITGPSNTQLPAISAAPLRLKSAGLAEQTLSRWFDTTAYAPAPAYSLGNGSRTEPNLRAPGICNADLGVSRMFTLTERVRLQFRSEFFSLANTPQYAAPQGSLTALDFGQITSASGGTRNIQFALRLSY